MEPPIAARVRGTSAPPLNPLTEQAAALRAAGRELIVLAQAMVDYGPPAAFMQALGRPDPPFHRYAPDPGIPALRRALTAYVARSFGMRVDPYEELVVTPGANHAAFIALTTLLSPGDEALLISPWYFNHEMAVRLLGARPRCVTCTPERQFVPAVEDILNAWSERLRVVILVNPNNPTGARYPDAWIDELATALVGDERWQNVWLLSDQTYQEIFFGGGYPRSPAATALRGRTLTVGSFSKSLGLAGWRLGFLSGPPEFLAEALKVQDSTVICAPHAAQWGLAQVLDRTEETAAYFGAKRRLLEARRDALLGPLKEDERLKLCVPQGACFAFIGLPQEIDSAAFARGLLDAHGVLVVPGAHFGESGRHSLRLSFGAGGPELLATAAGRLRDYLGAWLAR